MTTSLQNRRDFLRISGEQRRKRGESEARIVCEGRIAKKSQLALASLSPLFPWNTQKLGLFCRLTVHIITEKLTGYRECEKDPWHRRIDRAGMQCDQAFACTQRQTCPDQSDNLLPLVCSCGTIKKINITLQRDIAKPKLEICSIWMLRFMAYTWNYFGTVNKLIFFISCL